MRSLVWFRKRQSNREFNLDPLAKVAIGKSGLEVTRLGLGGAPLSGVRIGDGDYGDTARDEAARIIRRAHELGINYFDTAPLYGAGKSEVRYGAALEGIDRDSYVISTKVGRVLEPVEGGMTAAESPDNYAEHYTVDTWTRDDVLRSIEESLQRLQTDHVEIVLVHDPDRAPHGERQAIDEGFPTLIELREQGVIKALGCGMNEWQMPAAFIRRFDIDAVLLAGRYTLLDHDAYDEFLPLCVERDVKIIVGGPYNSGILARDLSGYVTFNYERAPEHLVEHARKLDAVCRRHGVDLKAAALQFVLAHPAVATAIPGAQSVPELEQNFALVGQEIPEDVWSEMKAEGLIPSDAPTP